MIWRRHYLHGGDSSKGYQYLCRAAQKAEQAYALAEATRYLEQALGLAPQVELRREPNGSISNSVMGACC